MDINTLTLDQYMALTQRNHGLGVVRPEIANNVNFEIKGQFMKRLGDNTFVRNHKDDAYKHVQKVLEIIDLFSITGVNHNVIMLRVFPIKLTRAEKRWKDRLPTCSIDTWALLEKAFIQKYCPPSRTAKRQEEIHNFKSEDDETFYCAWERCNDLLFKCPQHDLNSKKKVNIFYKVLDILTRQMLDSQG
ncbi:ribonuclease H-like domain-containing protein [Tanacetum coccineum]|uniref:Ribonuclease H-like domain-containing protein n=1 Tax=Tanacetum coccineum TaxID=301880 RepID=A0ABQ5C8L6_9ASTR